MTSFVSNPVLGHPSLNFIKRNNLSTITAVAAVAVGVTGVSVIYGLTQEVILFIYIFISKFSFLGRFLDVVNGENIYSIKVTSMHEKQEELSNNT